MKYLNISDKALKVPSVEGDISVSPNETFLTSPKFAARFIESGEVAIAENPKQSKKQKGEI